MTTISTLLARREPVVNLLAAERPVSEAVELMARRRVGAVLVAEDGRLAGIFTERDVVRRVLAQDRLPAEVELGAVMSADPITTSPDEQVHAAVAKMHLAKCRHLPVMIEGQVADTLSMRDLLVTELGEKEQEITGLQRYIRGDRAR